jgi:ABC-2 type transport system permease protein
MRLLRSELLRARSRRLVWMVVLGGLLATLIAWGFAAYYSHKPTAAEVATAQQAYDRNLAACLRHTRNEVLPGYDSIDQYCSENSGPYLDGFLLRDLDTIMHHTATFVILLALIVGASLGGADWTNNTMTTLLTWESRRVRVFFVRAAVVVACVIAITVFIEIVFAAIAVLVAATRGTTAFLPPDFWRTVALTVGRVSVMAAAFAVIAYAIAMVGRSTVSSLGLVFGYLIVFEGIIAGFRPSIQGNLLVRAAVVVIGHQPIVDESGNGIPRALMDVPRGWLVVGVYMVVIAMVGLLVFRRRDVT